MTLFLLEVRRRRSKGASALLLLLLLLLFRTVNRHSIALLHRGSGATTRTTHATLRVNHGSLHHHGVLLLSLLLILELLLVGGTVREVLTKAHLLRGGLVLLLMLLLHHHHVVHSGIVHVHLLEHAHVVLALLKSLLLQLVHGRQVELAIQKDVVVIAVVLLL